MSNARYRPLMLILIMLVLCQVAILARSTSDYNWHNHGNLVFYDTATFESTGPVAPVVFYDDFIGSITTVPTSAESGYNWIALAQGTTPTVAIGADSVMGTVECALSAGSNTQEAVLYCGNQRNWRVGYGLIMEARVRAEVLPSGSAARMFIGFAGDQSTGEISTRIGFTFRYSSASASSIYADVDDNTTDTSADTTDDIAVKTWYILRIDASSASAVKFFVDGVEVEDGLAYGGTTTALVLQPLIKVYKSTGTTVGSIQVDYVRIWQNRS